LETSTNARADEPAPQKWVVATTIANQKRFRDRASDVNVAQINSRQESERPEAQIGDINLAPDQDYASRLVEPI
jgi:hypothetical protein